MKKTAFLLITLLLTTSVFSQIKAPQNTHFQIVGYVPSYKNIDAIPDHSLQRLTVACYAFASIDSTGILKVRDEKQLKKFAKRAHKLGIKAVLSFNGSHRYYAKMVSSAQSRARFIESAWRLVKKYRLDGLDNDWEYPLGSDGSGLGNLELMKEFSSLCHGGKKQYLLTAAITPGKYVGNATAGLPDEIFDYLDWVNVMVYDDYSEVKEGMHHSTYELMLESMDYWVGVRGVTLNKMVIGMPAYGVPSGIRRSGNTRDYNGIIRAGGSVMGDVAMISSFSHPEPYPIYYNGIKTIKDKTKYCVGNSLGGIMFWEVAGDRHDDLSLIGAAVEEIPNDILPANPKNKHKK
ncbi:MAG: glycoside hydrolase family 18 protein [Flavobacteriales bacterium]|nr:glycoside hydrolase family 18 protein [Flavobacteriales bacterium]